METAVKDKENERRDERRFDRLTERLSLPKDFVYGECLISMLGNTELTIENYRNICLFEENCIVVALKHDRLLVQGSRLEILYYREDELKIRGRISGLQFLGERGKT
ncbi:MAG: sporulation protein [Lachnospiraceae bacterium]|nr:sporulation protein [Lachnospiraceae bacterium]